MKGICVFLQKETEGEADRRTKIDVTSHSYFRHCHFDQLTIFIFRRSDVVCERASRQLWHSEKAFPRHQPCISGLCFRKFPLTQKSEVMTHRRSVPVQYRNLNTPLLSAQIKRVCHIFSSWQKKKRKKKMTDELCVINVEEVGWSLMYLFGYVDERKQEKRLSDRQNTWNSPHNNHSFH